jgi:hypothetical protein
LRRRASAFEAAGRAEPFQSGLEEVAPMQLPGLAAYFADWMKMITPA